MRRYTGILMLAFIIVLVSAHPLPGQQRVSQTDGETLVIGVSAMPGLGIPVGPRTAVFSLGGGGLFSGHLSLPFYPPLAITLQTGYNLAPVRAESSLSMVYGGGGLRLQYKPLSFLGLGVFAGGGYGYHLLNTDSAVASGTPYLEGGAAVSFFLSPQFSINVAGAYRHFFDLYQDVAVSAGITYHLNIKRVKAIEFTLPQLQSIYPLLFNQYKDNPVGQILISNTEDRSVTDVEVFFELEKYTQTPRKCRVKNSIGPGEAARVDLLLDLEDVGLVFAKEEKVKAEILVTYKYKSFRYRQRFPAEMLFSPNQTIIWDDLRKAGLFVTEADPVIEDTARRIADSVRLVSCRELDPHLVTAMGIYNTLQALEIECSDVANPPYAKLSGKTGEIDFVQFPHQTLTTAEGDAVELAVLFASLLEASGIETAFVHVPGKIFPAFSPMLTDTGTQYTFFNPDTLFIEKGGRIWIPVDITASNLDFRGAVISARKQWEEDQENVLLYSLTECREAYHPLGAQTGTGEAVVLPTTIAELYKEAEAEHIDWMIEERIVALQEEISRSGNDERTINALGVLYARYEKYDEAIGEFTRTTVEHEYMPSLVNLGNIYYLEDDLRMAKPFYERAYEVAPFDPRVLLAVAKVNHKLENYGNARDAYDKLVNIEPELAQQFSYLNLTGEEAVEAAKKVKEKDVVVWIDE